MNLETDLRRQRGGQHTIGDLGERGGQRQVTDASRQRGNRGEMQQAKRRRIRARHDPALPHEENAEGQPGHDRRVD